MNPRHRWARLWPILLTMLLLCACTASGGSVPNAPGSVPSAPSDAAPAGASTALGALGALPVKGRAAKTGYARAEFGTSWTDANGDLWGRNGLDTRQDVLSRDLVQLVCKSGPTKKAAPHCAVKTGVLHDPYTARTIDFVRRETSSSAVQIDHVVALGDAWQKGAQQLSAAQRIDLANDPLELVAVDGPTNQQKGDADAATWLPPNKSFRCAYVARQIAVKAKYSLWVTTAEKAAMTRVLSTCAGQPLATLDTARLRTF